jgi:hypothetical protein
MFNFIQDVDKTETKKKRKRKREYLGRGSLSRRVVGLVRRFRPAPL